MPIFKGKRPGKILESYILSHTVEAHYVQLGKLYAIELLGIRGANLEERVFETSKKSEADLYLRGLITGATMGAQ